MNYNMFDEIDYFTNFKGNKSYQDDNGPLGIFNYNENMNSNKLSLSTPYEAYIKGNLFKNLYNGYKNYTPYKIKINNEQEEMFLNLSEAAFVAHELNLYLDNFPNDKEALELFNKYRKMSQELIKNYERKYGPIKVSSNDDMKIPFAWETDKWPWEV